MKLNTKRTFLVGFAFFLICIFWQAYDTLVPLMLTNKFGLDQTWSGLIMSLDNILALFMLPLFGAISDKINTRYGKRTPFIFIGTICAIVCFVGLTFADNAQMSKVLEASSRETYWEQNYVVENKEYQNVTNSEVEKSYSVQDYAALIRYNTAYKNLSDEQKTTLKAWYTKDVLAEGETADDLFLDENLQYVYSNSKDGGEQYAAVKTGKDDKGAVTYTYLTGKNAGQTVSGNDAKQLRPVKVYSSIVLQAQSRLAKDVSGQNVYIIVIYIIMLLLCLIAMATFRSPAVALMPDVTVKPLRSKANAIINLMGAAGGIIVLALGMIFGTGNIANQMMSYTWFIVAVCGIMAVALAVFIFTVKEKKWNAEMLEQQAVLDEEEAKAEAEQSADNTEKTEVTVEVSPDEMSEEVATEKTSKNKLPKDKLVSLILILASVALWFIGYNAVTSKYSVYALNVLHMDYNSTLIIAQAAAIVSYIPVGIISGKLGRKKTILIGVAMLTVSFFGAIFINANSPAWLMWILFALAGIAWATINVNSFPMVVELAKGSDIGKYTGYYYTASMAAQVVTPILSGALMDAMGTMGILFPYAAIFVALSFVTMLFVKHGDSRPETPKDKLEMLAGTDD